jgi:hypothetical protein
MGGEPPADFRAVNDIEIHCRALVLKLLKAREFFGLSTEMAHDIMRDQVSYCSIRFIGPLLARNHDLPKHPDEHGQQRYLADNQRRHLDRVFRASLNHLRSVDEVHMAVTRVISKREDTIMIAPATF